MWIYLATTSHECEKAKAFMERVVSRGHQLTYDWTAELHRESSMSDTEIASRALRDTSAVREADALIVVMQERMAERMVGAAIEIGVAIGCHKPVWIAEEECTFDHFFRFHPAIRCCRTLDSILDALDGAGDVDHERV